ncbi:MAG: cytochrome P450 [Actinomycetota bacterium]|nr:cytochrome P450 [Actinomycetota bacterium]
MIHAGDPVPPGSLGLPVVGESLAILRNPFGFLEERQRRHGNVFKSRVLGRRVAFLAGIEGAKAFYDDENISRAEAHPSPVVTLFGGSNIEMFDGPKHRALKTIALGAFDHAAIAGYLPGMQVLIEERLSECAREAEFSATAALRRLAIEVICLNIMGLTPGPNTDAIRRDYETLIKGFVSIPLALPGTPYGRAIEARDRLLSTIGHVVTDRRKSPADDGLSRVLAGQAPDGQAFTDRETVLEVHHVIVAGFTVYVLIAEAMRQLKANPEISARCAAEITQYAHSGPLSLELLRRLESCTRVVLESKRCALIAPLAFGRAKRDFSCAGLRIPEGWAVYLALSRCNRNPEVFRDPERFDPDRFGPERAEDQQDPFAFIPQGAAPWTGHQCLGLEYSTILVLCFLTLLIRGYEWDFPPQNLSYRWTTIPPEPHDGLRARLHPRR